MKVEWNGQVGSTSRVEGTSRQVSGSTSTSAAGSNAAVSQDRTTLRSDSSSVQSLVGQALSNPDVRQNKVDSLRQQISSGEYNVDPGKIASAIISEGGQ